MNTFVVRLKPLLLSLLISLGVGGLAAFFTKDAMAQYQQLNQPVGSPPSWVFGVVWTILFVLMGVSAYLVYSSNNKNKSEALKIYGIQLVLNFCWTILFFGYQMRLAAFILLILLWIFIVLMIAKFYQINPLAGLLQIPYLIWVTYAGYLNVAIYLLNR